MSSVKDYPNVADYMPGVFQEGGDPLGNPVGRQVVVSVPLGAPKLVDGTTYKQALFVAPADGCRIIDGKISAAVAIAGGTNTLAFENYDASANSGANILSATNIDPTGVTAKEGLALTLSSTEANLEMDEGDVLWATLTCGTMTTDGEGYVATFVIEVPDLA